MAILVREVTDADDAAAWAAYVEGHPHSTVYHRLSWRAVLARGLRYRSWLLLAHDENGAVCGALPLYLVPGPLGSRLAAIPFRDRGGPLWNTDEALDALLAAARRLQHRVGAKSIVLKTVHALPQSVASGHDFERSEYWVHSYLPLGGMTAASLWSGLGGKTRNMLRQARQHGLTCRPAALGAEACDRWYGLHVSTQRRLGLPPFPRLFFAAMLQELGAEDSIELLEVWHAEQPCAAALLLLNGDTCIYGYAASAASAHRLRANDLLVYDAIERALQRSLRTFDFGSDSPLQKSLLFFKRKWGAVQAPLPRYATRGSMANSDSSEPRYARWRALVRRVPEGLLAAVGGRFTRYLG